MLEGGAGLAICLRNVAVWDLAVLASAGQLRSIAPRAIQGMLSRLGLRNTERILTRDLVAELSSPLPEPIHCMPLASS